MLIEFQPVDWLFLNDINRKCELNKLIDPLGHQEML